MLVKLATFFDQIWLVFIAMMIICGPCELFFIKLGPTEQFFFGIWPTNQFEFDTPALHKFNRKDSCFSSGRVCVSH